MHIRELIGTVLSWRGEFKLKPNCDALILAACLLFLAHGYLAGHWRLSHQTWVALNAQNTSWESRTRAKLVLARSWMALEHNGTGFGSLGSMCSMRASVKVCKIPRTFCMHRFAFAGAASFARGYLERANCRANYKNFVACDIV